MAWNGRSCDVASLRFDYRFKEAWPMTKLDPAVMRPSLVGFTDPARTKTPKRPFYTFMDSYDDAVEEGGGDDCPGQGSKKRKLTAGQAKSLEMSFEMDNKLEAERKQKLAEELGLQPRQVAVWFQNRRARWKAKQLEQDYGVLKSEYDAVVVESEALRAEIAKLTTQLQAGRKPNALQAGRKPNACQGDDAEAEGGNSKEVSGRLPTVDTQNDKKQKQPEVAGYCRDDLPKEAGLVLCKKKGSPEYSESSDVMNVESPRDSENTLPHCKAVSSGAETMKAAAWILPPEFCYESHVHQQIALDFHDDSAYFEDPYLGIFSSSSSSSSHAHEQAMPSLWLN